MKSGAQSVIIYTLRNLNDEVIHFNLMQLIAKIFGATNRQVQTKRTIPKEVTSVIHETI